MVELNHIMEADRHSDPYRTMEMPPATPGYGGRKVVKSGEVEQNQKAIMFDPDFFISEVTIGTWEPTRRDREYVDAIFRELDDWRRKVSERPPLIPEAKLNDDPHEMFKPEV